MRYSTLIGITEANVLGWMIVLDICTGGNLAFVGGFILGLLVAICSAVALNCIREVEQLEGIE